MDVERLKIEAKKEAALAERAGRSRGCGLEGPENQLAQLCAD